MKFLITLSWLALAGALLAAPKFAVIRVTDIYQELPSTVKKQKEFQIRRAAIEQGPRAEGVRKVISELLALGELLEGNRDKIDTKEGKKIIRDFEIKRQEAETLRQDFEGFSAEESKRIDKDMITATRITLQRITDAASQVAKEQNLDGILDISGDSNTGLPFVLYSRDALDISEDVVGLLGEKPLEEAADVTEIVPVDEIEKKKEN